MHKWSKKMCTHFYLAPRSLGITGLYNYGCGGTKGRDFSILINNNLCSLQEGRVVNNILM